MNERIKSIAVFRALQLGDMLCAVPAIRAIKKTFNGAAITLIGLPGQRSFASRFSRYFDDFIGFPGWPGLPERSFDTTDVMRFLHEVQARRYDLVLQLHGNGYIVNPMCMLFGAGAVAGLCKPGDYCPDPDRFPPFDDSEHEIVRFLKVAKTVGARSDGTDLEFPFMEGELERAQVMLRELGLHEKKFICIHPGARDEKRRWPACDFGRVGDALTARGYTVVLTGSLDEASLLRDVQGCLHTSCINLVDEYGHIGIGELAGIISAAEGIVCNDTGVSHIAAALRIRSVVIFTPYSDPARWAPLDHNLHVAIRPEEAGNVMYVIKTVVNHLDVAFNNSGTIALGEDVNVLFK